MNESFFDFSGGLEDFAILAPEDARVLDEAAIGITEASEELVFETTAPVLSVDDSSGESAPSSPLPAAAHGAPAPPLWGLMLAGAVWWWRERRMGARREA
ncbi:MAG: hypothetical protein J6386_11615 [Candidatus Synoicihabitans palmerolidicus]|nr:hypothetical protein [Candidatus Synoicihabitans palmerolidicus]